MIEIRYTIGNSVVWHSIYLDFKFQNETHDELMIALILTQELKRLGIQDSAKQVIVLNEDRCVIAKTSDISEIGKFEYSNENEKRNGKSNSFTGR